MKDKIVKFLKFGYVSENIITYGIFFIAVILYLFRFHWGSAYIDTESTDIQKLWFYTFVFYFRYVETILVMLLIKFVLEYFVQNQRLLKKIALSNNIANNDIENINKENINKENINKENINKENINKENINNK